MFDFSYSFIKGKIGANQIAGAYNQQAKKKKTHLFAN